MAGTLTLPTTYLSPSPAYVVSRVAFPWTSDASGNVSGNPTGVLYGTILKVQFVPGAGGSQPTSGYSVTLLDTSGIDVLAGQGSTLSNTTATAVIPGIPFKDGTTTGTAPCVVAEALRPVVSGAGNAKSGTLVIYLR